MHSTQDSHIPRSEDSGVRQRRTMAATRRAAQPPRRAAQVALRKSQMSFGSARLPRRAHPPPAAAANGAAVSSGSVVAKEGINRAWRDASAVAASGAAVAWCSADAASRSAPAKSDVVDVDRRLVVGAAECLCLGLQTRRARPKSFLRRPPREAGDARLSHSATAVYGAKCETTMCTRRRRLAPADRSAVLARPGNAVSSSCTIR